MNEPLFHDVMLRCSVAHAFDTFTRRVNLWWPLGHRRFDSSTFYCDPREGGQLMEVASTGERFVWADVVSVDPPNAIVFAWHPGKNTDPTKTEITFEMTGQHETRVQLTHSEGEAALGDDWSKRAVLFNTGWGIVLSAIEEFIETEGMKR